jgi:hypothetical protein
MSGENEQKLISLYPQMFMGTVWNRTPSRIHKLYNGTLLWLSVRYPYFRKFRYKNGVNPYNFEFACSDGWFSILGELISKIKESDYRNGVVTQTSQIKEKFGTLRFYPLYGASNEIWKLITEYENKSSKVCEFTGSITDVGMWTYGWMNTMCRLYAEKEYIRRKDDGRLANGVLFENCWKPIDNKLD